MRKEILVFTLFICGWQAAQAHADDAAALLTQGKLDVDLGKPQTAAKAFEAVAADTSAPTPLRAEALVRLGLVRRDLGDAKATAQAFERAWTEHGRDKEALRLLVQAVSGALPGEERWNEIWDKVIVKVDRTNAGHPIVRVEWPGVPTAPHTYTGNPITLDLKDADLQNVFRTFADVTQLNIVVWPRIGGKITVNVRDVPWDQALDLILATGGYASNHVGNLVEIGLPTRIGMRRHFEGKPIDIEYKEVGLLESLQRIAENGGQTVSVAPGIWGKVTLKLTQVPWDQAFDVLVRVNGLTWKMEGKNIRVERRAESK